jgi:hypothetical protein
VVPSSAGTSIVFGGRPSTTSASTLLPSRGPSSNLAVTVGPIPSAGVVSKGFSNSGTCARNGKHDAEVLSVLPDKPYRRSQVRVEPTGDTLKQATEEVGS